MEKKKINIALLILLAFIAMCVSIIILSIYNYKLNIQVNNRDKTILSYQKNSSKDTAIKYTVLHDSATLNGKNVSIQDLISVTNFLYKQSDTLEVYKEIMNDAIKEYGFKFNFINKKQSGYLSFVEYLHNDWKDSLESQKNSNIQLNKDFNKLNSDYRTLVDRYNNLINTCNSKLIELNKASDSFHIILKSYNRLLKESGRKYKIETDSIKSILSIEKE
ncbi:hypothetical protein [Rhizosphaericola mali]|uniref:Uncharacterized protein n=1 Tax=Rhizosphaericola mali TaxID=2545455 RepID=A0A5P2FZB0_9BACT|nr:hypothetical protein [Rhizosphaericola mali]QES88884.1 hypothetical protein E0W69_009520 [Rhizosphaericola mali]